MLLGEAVIRQYWQVKATLCIVLLSDRVVRYDFSGRLLLTA